MTWAEEFGAAGASLSDPSAPEDDTTKSASEVPELDSIDDNSPSGLRQLLALLEEESSETSSFDQQLASNTAKHRHYSNIQSEYEVPVSAFKETKSIEELADLATGTYKIVSMGKDADDMPEDFFEYSRRVRTLRSK